MIYHNQNREYQFTKKLYESANSLVYQGFLKENNQPVILKILKENYPTASELTRYKQEYEITRTLNANNVVKAYALQRYENSLLILLEDFGGQCLKSLLSQTQLSLENFLKIAIKITESLATIHTANIIHKDINPSNIVYNPQTEQLKIIDFGISSRLSQEFITVLPPDRLEGTLAYIAPEQTGRMNRGIDYRSDFYALGVTFYELLTNQLPFETSDPMELVHCHIAQQPLSVHELIPDIPVAVSDIINKLLAKTPEDRYQNAWGIKADLETCLSQLQSQGQISPFTLGSQDITDKFHIPQKLYGREQEVNQLLAAFERVSQGATEMILISGYSGIGKSALVNEIHKPVTRQRGQLISGKFDQLQRDIPYFAIAHAFQDLIRKLLTEPEIKLQAWKKKILKALGNNGQIIIDVIPEFEKIIGKQAPVEQLGKTESQNRFNLFFQRFLHIFCQQEHPLVIFIDDLQWADLSSLNLIEQLLSDPNNQYLLLIGAYRDNEVSPTHPLIKTLEKINQANVVVNQITLSPLKIKHINQLIANTLNCSKEASKPLAELINYKTGGNPFFLTQLLYSLHQENLLVLNPHQSSEDKKLSYWQWDIEQIKSVSITDNVVDLMVRKIEKLEHKTQQVIKLASCIGNYFNLEVLSIVNNKSQLVTARELQSALDEGLIVPLDNKYKIPLLGHSEELSNRLSENYFKYPQYIPYKFLHDRVQQAAYSLILEAKKKQLHLEIGRLLLKNIKEDNLQNNIFDIVNQFNQGYSLITEQLEKYELARLNLQAIRKAKDSSAYEIALIYVEIALKLLSSDSWENRYNLTLEIYTEAIQIQYINYQFTRAETLSTIVLQNTKEVLDTVEIYVSKINYLHAQLKLEEVVNTAFEILARLGVCLPSNRSQQKEKVAQYKQEIESLLQNKSIAQLANLPAMTDPYKLAAVRLLVLITPSAIIHNPQVYGLVTLTALSLCLQYGNSPLAASVYCCYGIAICGTILTQDVRSGYQFGKLAYDLLNNHNSDDAKPFTTHHYYGFIRHWKEPFKQLKLADFEYAIQIALERGDFQLAGFNAISYCLFSIFRGFNLEDFEPKCLTYSKLIKPEQEYEYYYYQACHKMVVNLLKEDRKDYYLLFEKTQKEEDELIQFWIDSNTDWLLFIYSLSKTFAAYFLKDYDRGLKTVYLSEKYSRLCSAYLIYPQNIFYSALTLLAVYHKADVEQKQVILKKVTEFQEKMFYYQENCPDNYENKYNLVEAEKARVLEQNWQAAEFYEKAIQGAKKQEFIHEEALAYERASEFYLALNREEIGQLYLRNVHHCYIRWGAKAKVKQLETEYPEYLLGVTSQRRSTKLSTTISMTGTDGEILDLTTVLKASQTISGEIKLERLLQNLMRIVIENAGAQSGFLILNHQGNWVVEAQGTLDREQVTVLQSIPIDYINPETSIPILPTTVINYVAHTQENLVLNNAVSEGQFINDSYIIAAQSKSILCTPLLNQGRLSGIVYLENNLATGAFTAERVELLNILSAQAAISIDNSRLYQTLEQRVEERTKELSQTLDVLKATQQELIFENELLKSEEQASSFDYQVGGSLGIDSPAYVVRSADRNLYQALKQGEFCYVLNSRQMGKSSLMVRMIDYLSREGFRCGAIDMTRIGSENVTPEQWYKGLAVELWRSFRLLRKVKLKTWWDERKDISPVQRLSQFIEEVLLVEVASEDNDSPPKIVVFIDEIDSVLGLNFTVNDFFALIRSCYNQRTINQNYQRLTFALFGVATPGNLINDRQKTPFNIGQAIQLEGFKEHEAQPLLNGLTEGVNNPQVLLKEILTWTGGQPFLTQKVCQLIRNSSTPIPQNKEAQWLEDLVQTKIINDWEAQDEPEHLKTIRDRILKNEYQPDQLLELYQQILHHGTVESTGSFAENELLLSGLIIKKQQTLQVRNRIYQSIFDSAWIEKVK